MSDRPPRGTRTDRRALIATAILAIVILVMFLLFDFGAPTAPDDTSGGPDPNFSAPQQPDETAPPSQN